LYALNARTGTKLWSFATGTCFFSSPAVANGLVYIGSADSHLYALNAKTGVGLWTYQTRDTISSSPAVANGVVYVGSDDETFYALDAKTGAKLWSYGIYGFVLFVARRVQWQGLYWYSVRQNFGVRPEVMDS
jgi:outer membrane protein assembly factor BamB